MRLKMETRSETDIWLIGEQIDKLNNTSKKEVTSLLMHYKNVCKKTDREALASTVNDVLEVSQRAGIPTSLKCDVVKKLNRLYIE